MYQMLCCYCFPVSSAILTVTEGCFSRNSNVDIMVSNPYSRPSPFTQVHKYLENLGDMANAASLTRGVRGVRDAAPPDQKRQGSTVSAVSALCIDHL